ncbi:unnamed protein product, partial [Polarella glacialis]
AEPRPPGGPCASGSAAKAARWLHEGQPVLSKSSGRLGVVLRQSRGQDCQKVTEEEVLLGAGVGEFGGSSASSASPKAGTRLGLKDILRFQDSSCNGAGWAQPPTALTLLPGRWLLERPSSSCSVSVFGTPDGGLWAAGQDDQGVFSVTGTEQHGLLEAKLEYVDVLKPAPAVSTLDGAWHALEVGRKPYWVALEGGRASTAGTAMGYFSAEGGHLWFTERASGKSWRALPKSSDLLCWEDGSIWRRLPAAATALAVRREKPLELDPPRCSSQEVVDSKSRDKDGGTISCSVTCLRNQTDGSAACVVFEVTGNGAIPDAMQTELRVDDRVVEVSRAEFTAGVSQGRGSKYKKSSIKGELFFDDLEIRVGSEVAFRFAGEYSGFSWAILQAAPAALSALVLGLGGGFRIQDNPLRPQQLSGSVGDSLGLHAEGSLGEGTTVSISGKTAEAVTVKRCGQQTSLALRPYDNNDEVCIEVLGPAVISFSFFRTEEDYDILEIAGTSYSGSKLPPPHFVPEGRKAVMNWTSDKSTTDEGWEFTVTAGVSHLRFEDGREVQFGARAAPWNQAGAFLSDAGHQDRGRSKQLLLVHVPDNELGLEAFDRADVAGRLVVISARSEEDKDVEASKKDEDADDEEEEDEESEEDADNEEELAEDKEVEDDEAQGKEKESEDKWLAPFSDNGLFFGRLLPRLQRAAEAGAVGVLFVSTKPSPLGAVKLRRDRKKGLQTMPDELPSIPAVILGQEIGADILSALRQGPKVSVGPSSRRFKLELQEPARPEESRGLAKLCLGAGPALRTVLRAELGRMVKGGRADEESELVLSEAVAALRSELGVAASPSCPLLPRLESGTEAALETWFREKVRKTMPVALPLTSVLPDPDASELRGEVWDYYYKGRLRGAGSFGTVREGWDRFTGDKVAIKKMKLSEDDHVNREDVLREFALLRDLAHPGLLRVLDLFPVGRKLFLVTELASQGDLTHHITCTKKTNEPWIAGIMRQVLQALRFLHRMRVVHHDVKPANILLTEHRLRPPEEDVPVALLADFGLSQVERFTAQEALKQSGAGNGTSSYMPAEWARGLSGPKTDAYALGVTLFEVLSGGNAPGEAVGDDGETPPVDWELVSHCSSGALSVTKALLDPE